MFLFVAGGNYTNSGCAEAAAEAGVAIAVAGLVVVDVVVVASVVVGFVGVSCDRFIFAV